MSTIASLRESPISGRRLPPLGTATSSTRPSFDYSPSETSPVTSNRSSTVPSKLNRVALREYYNIKAAAAKANEPGQSNGTISETSSLADRTPYERSELDEEDFDAEAFVKRVLEEQDLKELLVTYSGLLGEIRALDSERKALVYDNYSKLITATETINRMRKSVENGEPVTGTLHVVIEGICAKAEELQTQIERASDVMTAKQNSERCLERMRAREVTRRVLDTPRKVRILVEKGNHEEAKKTWEKVKTLLESWKERRVGGPDVDYCLEDGNAALRGEPPSEKNWLYSKDENSQI